MDFFELTNLVDTLKLHIYPVQELEQNKIESFNKEIDELKELKAKAMDLKSNNKDERFINKIIGNTKFQVMAQSQSGFAVVLKNGDYSISLKRVSNFANPCIKVEFRAEFLCRLGYVTCINIVKSLISSYFLDTFKTKVSELHICKDIQGFGFTELDIHKIKTRSRKKENHIDTKLKHFINGHKFTGCTLGSGDFMIRIYNKSEEIKKFKEKGFVETLRWQKNDNYDPLKTVWRIEFQFRRAKLKDFVDPKYGRLDGFENVLNAIPSLWSHGLESFKHLDLSDNFIFNKMRGYGVYKNGKRYDITVDSIKKAYQRASISNKWAFLKGWSKAQHQKIYSYKDTTRPEIQYVKNAIKGVFSTLIKYERGTFKVDRLSQITKDLDEENIVKNELSIVQEAKIKTLDYITDTTDNQYRNGVVVDGIQQFQEDVYKNIFDTFTLLDTEPDTLYSFERYFSSIIKNISNTYDFVDKYSKQKVTPKQLLKEVCY